MADAAFMHADGPCPISRDRVVQFRARQWSLVGMVGPTSRDQHPAIAEQRRRVEQPTIIEAACDRPISGGRIVATGTTNALIIGS